MRIPIRTKGRRARVSSVISRPAPVKGWNARDPIAAMSPGEAIDLINFFPTTTDVVSRKGISNHVTGIGQQVESLMVYNTPSGTQTLFCAAGTNIYDVSGSSATTVVTGQTNARWQHVNFTNSSGISYLCCFNGMDSPQYWDGTSWITVTGISTPAITGLTTSNIVSAAMHKRRMWLCEKNSLKAWYLPVDAVGGAANAIDLSGIAKRGGYIMEIGTWTLDAGEGLDDYWVAVTSEGEVIVYGGTDPSNGATWAIKGVWYIGEPISRRCMTKFGGDLLLVLKNGVFPLSKALLSSSVNPRVAITDKISQAMNTAASIYSSNFGWELVHYPAADMLILNVPVVEGVKQEQYVMNAITGSWCRFTGWNVNCFAVSGGELYCGGDGVVSKAWDTFSDNNTNITAEAKTAFDYFNTKNKKAWKMARPIISTSGSPTVEIGINVDYEEGDNFGAVTFSSSASAYWGVGLWGMGLWASGLAALKNWIGISGMGLCAATRLKVASSKIEVRWQSTDYLFEPGDGVV